MMHHVHAVVAVIPRLDANHLRKCLWTGGELWDPVVWMSSSNMFTY